MKLLAVGVNHKTAPVAVREQLAIDPSLHRESLDQLRVNAGLDEVILLSTCNRVEVYATSVLAECDQVIEALAELRSFPQSQLRGHCFASSNESAARHIFRVAASLESMVVGEPQILGQIKDAYQKAIEGGTVGAVLDRCFTMAFRGAKRVRNETEIARGGASVPSVTVDLANRIFGALESSRATIVGAGDMAQQTATYLKVAGCRRITVVNRNEARGRALAEAVEGHYKPWDDLEIELCRSDIVVASTGSQQTVIDVPLMKRVMKARKHAPLFAIDIAVPRDIDEAAKDLDQVFLYDIDDLRQLVDENLESRNSHVEAADRLLNEQLVEFLNWSRTRNIGGTIREIQENTQSVIAAEIERALLRNLNLSAEQREALNHLPRTIANKLLHRPITYVREEVARDPQRGDEILGLAQQLFGRSNSTGSRDPNESD